MPEDVCFAYRLPLTYLRVTGNRTETTDLDTHVGIECKSAVTTEVGADTRSRFPVRLSAEAAATQKAGWTLTSDGRLSGADVTTAVERFGGLAVGLKAGSTVLGLAGPPLIAAGPVGWVALAGAVGVAGIGAAALSTHSLRFAGENVVHLDLPESKPPTDPPDADPGEWDVHPRYVLAHREDALELANLRSTLATAARQHARAAHAAAFAEAAEDRSFWAYRMAELQWLLRATTVGAARAETAYASWVAATVTSVTTSHDFRLRIEELPRRDELVEWAASTKKVVSYPPWWDLLDQLQLIVSVDLEPQVDEEHEDTIRAEYTALETSEVVHYRPPRPAIIRVWKALPPDTGDKRRFVLELVETRRELVNRPGNETSININTDHHTTNAVKVTFDDTGALTGVTTDLKDPSLQRAADVSGLISKVGESVTAGHDLREAIAPPSYVDRAAEAKAKAELGLTPSPTDPLKGLKDQLAEQQLRAQLKLAQQMQAAGSLPIFVTVSQG